MTVSHKLYMIFVYILIAFYIFSGGMMYIIMSPKPESQLPLKLILWIITSLCMSLIITSTIIIIKKELAFIPTVLQNIFLVLSMYGIPIALFGFFLLYRKHQKESQDKQRTLPPENTIFEQSQ